MEDSNGRVKGYRFGKGADGIVFFGLITSPEDIVFQIFIRSAAFEQHHCCCISKKYPFAPKCLSPSSYLLFATFVIYWRFRLG